MVTTHTKMSLIQARGVKCEVCRCTRWKGCSILPGLVMARKDRLNPAYTDENAILVCRMCFYLHGYNKRRPHKRRTKAEMAELSTVRPSMLDRLARDPTPLSKQEITEHWKGQQ